MPARDSLQLSPPEAQRLFEELVRVWEAMFAGDELGDLGADLQRLGAFYGPTARPSGIRELLRPMPNVRVRQRTITGFDPPLLIRGDPGVVLTPEGRVALEQLKHFESFPSVVSLSLHDERLVDQYREWSQSHVQSVVGARGVRPPALALVVLLLLVDARDMNTALAVDRKMSAEADCALREVLLAFVRAVSTKPASLKDPVWAWPISRAQARFDGVRRYQPSDAPERFWIEEEMRHRTLEDIAAELVPRRRIRSAEHALGAVQALAQAFDERRGVLRSAGIGAPPVASRQGLYDELRLAFATVSQ